VPPAEPQSPCNRACTLEPDTEICLGCFRTLAEILRWSSYSAEEKQAVLDTLDRRRQQRREALERLRRTPRAQPD